MKVLTMAYPPGVGKTATVVAGLLDAVQQSKSGAVYVHSTAQAEEVAAQLGSGAQVIRGRGQPDPNNPGSKMCLRSDVAHEVVGAGLSVTKSLCADCPLSCGWKAQFLSSCPIWLMQHAHITLPRHASCGTDFAVVDEAFWLSMLKTGEMSLATLAKVIPPGFDRRFVAAILRGLRNDSLNKEITSMPDGIELLKNASVAVFTGHGSRKFDGTATAPMVRHSTRGRAAASLVASILRCLITEAEAAPNRPGSHVCRLHLNSEGVEEVSFSLLSEARALEGVERVMLIDADADPEIIKRILPGCNLEFDRRDVTRNADVTQVFSSTNSLQRLNSETSPLPEIIKFAAWQQGRTAVFMPKSIRVGLTCEPVDQGTLPVAHPWRGLDVGHYRNLKGTNVFQNHNTIFVVGRAQLPPNALEKRSGLFLRDIAPLAWAGEYVREDRGYNHPSGRGASVQVHPEPRFQMLLEQVRERELIQAIDRGRLHNPEQRKTVYVFTNLVLPIEISRFVTEREIIPTWRGLAIDNGGLILSSPKWLATRFPARFAAASVARDWLQDGWPCGSVDLTNRTTTKVNRTAPPNGTATVASFDPLAPIPIEHRRVAPPSRRSGLKRALHVGSPMEIPAALKAATGQPTEFVAYLYGGAAAMMTDGLIAERRAAAALARTNSVPRPMRLPKAMARTRRAGGGVVRRPSHKTTHDPVRFCQVAHKSMRERTSLISCKRELLSCLC